MLGSVRCSQLGVGRLYVQRFYVVSTGYMSYPLVRKSVVTVVEKIGLGGTLNEALGALFGGDSGANAGDSLEPVGTPAEETEAPAEPAEPEAAPAPDETQSETGIIISTELQAALADARAALLEREAAYRDNDLVAAAEADRRLTAALDRALVLSDQ